MKYGFTTHAIFRARNYDIIAGPASSNDVELMMEAKPVSVVRSGERIILDFVSIGIRVSGVAVLISECIRNHVSNLSRNQSDIAMRCRWL